MKFAHLSDCHLATSSSRLKHFDPYSQVSLVLDNIKDSGINNIIITGDIAESRKGVEWFLKEIEKREFVPYFCFGNHDVEFIKHYIKYKRSRNLYFKMIIEGNLCLFLDTSLGIIDSRQMAWFEKEIKYYKGPIYMFTHYPVIDCGNIFMDKKYPLNNRFDFEKTLIDKNNEIVIFCGHYHTSIEVSKKNIKQYITPSTLYQIKLDSEDLEITNEPIGYRVINFLNFDYSTYIQEIRGSPTIA